MSTVPHSNPIVINTDDLAKTLAEFCSADEAKLKAHGSKMISHNDIKVLAAFLGIPKSGSKADLIDAIRMKNSNRKKLEVDLLTTFRKDVNTVGRLLNILMADEDALMRSNLLGGREELQAGVTYDQHPSFVLGVDRYNDWSFNSGGLVEGRTEFLPRVGSKICAGFVGIDPEKPNTTGVMTCSIAWKLFQSVRKAYAIAIGRWTVSGKHNNQDFYDYCQGDLDVLYLYCWVNKSGNPELANFCAEGYEVDNGFDCGVKRGASGGEREDVKKVKKEVKTPAAAMELTETLKAKNELIREHNKQAADLNRIHSAKLTEETLSLLIERKDVLNGKMLSLLSVTVDANPAVRLTAFQEEMMDDYKADLEYTKRRIQTLRSVISTPAAPAHTYDLTVETSPVDAGQMLFAGITEFADV